jgi:hypothetical protein
VLLLLEACTRSTTSGLWAQDTAPDSGAASFIATIDPRALHDSSLTEVLIALVSRAENPDGWPRWTVKSASSPYQIADRVFGVSAAYPNARFLLAGLIAHSNRLRLKEVVPAGGQVRVPPLPTLVRAPMTDPELTQFVSMSSPVVIAARRSDVWASPLTLLPADAALQSAPTWTVYGTKTEMRAILLTAAELGKLAKNKPILIVQASTSVIARDDTASSLGQPQAAQADTFLAPLVPVTQLSHGVGLHFYVFDDFGDGGPAGCVHGLKVLDVFRNMLDSLRLDSTVVAPAIKAWNLNYIVERDSVRARITRYATTYSPGVQKVMQREAVRIAAAGQGLVGTYESLYLKTLFWQAMQDTSAAIISMSYAFEITGHEVLPERLDARSRVLLLNAATNQLRPVESSIMEPIRSYYQKRGEIPAMVVGGIVGDTLTFGMYSQNGRGLAALGSATGWSRRGSCIAVSDTGNSFAAPQVGAIAFAALAHFRASGQAMPPMELRRRLALSSRVNARYLNKAASAGVPQLGLLLRGDGAHLISTDGTIRDVRLDLPRSFLLTLDPGGIRRRLRVGRKCHGGEVPAFYIKGNRVLFYHEDDAVWSSATIDSLHIVLQGERPELLKLGSFAGGYSGLVDFGAQCPGEVAAAGKETFSPN